MQRAAKRAQRNGVSTRSQFFISFPFVSTTALPPFNHNCILSRSVCVRPFPPTQTPREGRRWLPWTQHASVVAFKGRVSYWRQHATHSLTTITLSHSTSPHSVQQRLPFSVSQPVGFRDGHAGKGWGEKTD